VNSNSSRLLGFIIASLAIRKKNRTLMEQEGGSDDELEDEEVDGPPAKRSRTGTGKIILDSEEEAFARFLPSIHPTPGATSQYRGIETQNQEEEEDRTALDDREELESNQDDANMGDGNGNGEDDEERLGFLDNGVCLHAFQSSHTYFFAFFRCPLLILNLQ
jgi:hypothetical protein